MKFRFHPITAVAAIFLGSIGPADADEPSVSYIFPAGGQRGTKVDVRVGGHYLHESCRWEMIGPGVLATPTLTRAEQTVWFEGPVIPLPDSQKKEDYPVDYKGSVSIDADSPLGLRRWRVTTSQGVTPSLPFVVGDLPEIVEDEIDGTPIPVRVLPPLTINGRIFPREDVDIWTFDARAGESYTCEVLAARIGSPLDSRLAVIGPNGTQLAENVDALGNDSRLNFTARVDGVHEVRIHDIEFDGLQHFVYRLTITGGPYIEHVYPLGGQRGKSVRLEFTGQNVPQEAVPVSIPDDANEKFLYRWANAAAASNPVWLEASDNPESLEQEPNDETDAARAFTIPAVLNGRIQSPGDIDCWRFDAAKGTKVEFDLRAARLGSPLDSVLTIRDADGKTLAESNDPAAGQTDSRLVFDPPADGTYSLVVADQFPHRGDARFAYRVHARSAEHLQPSFELQLPSDALTVLRGGEAKLKITAERLQGFSGSITLRAEDLPAGVAVEDVTISDKKSDATLVFKATSDAVIDVHRLRIVGRADGDGGAIEKAAFVPKMLPSDLERDHLMLAVAMPTPFKIVGQFESKYAARGSTYWRHYSIERGGFMGPLTVRLAERQVRHLQGVTGPTIVVPPGVDDFYFPVQLPPWMEVGRTSRTCVMAVGQVIDKDGSQHTVSSTSHEQNDQIIVLVDPAQMAIRLDRASVLAQRGERTSIGFEVIRGQSTAGPVKVELVVPTHIHGVLAAPIELSADESDGTLDIEFATDRLGPFNMPLSVRAISVQGESRTIAEAPLEVVSDQPAFR